MTTVGKLFIQKQELIARLRRNPAPRERNEIERLLAKIESALDQLVQPGTKNE